VFGMHNNLILFILCLVDNISKRHILNLELLLVSKKVASMLVVLLSETKIGTSNGINSSLIFSHSHSQ
jgi:hypothetical protein